MRIAKYLPTINLVMISLILALIISACKEQPYNATLFGDSQKAVYLIDVDKNLTATVNLTFYYNADGKSNGKLDKNSDKTSGWIEIRLPNYHVQNYPSQATLIAARDNYGEITEIRPHKYWFQGKIVTSNERFFIKTHYLNNSAGNMQPVTIVYKYQLLPVEAITEPEIFNILNISSNNNTRAITIKTRESLFHLIYFSPLLDTAATAAENNITENIVVKNTFEIKLPKEFFIYSAYGLLHEPEKETSKKINMQLDQKNHVVRLGDAGINASNQEFQNNIQENQNNIQTLNIKFIADLAAPGSLNIEELDKYIIISKEENSSIWFNKTVAPHFPVIEKMTGLRQPYGKFIIVFPPDCSFEAYTETMSVPHTYQGDGLILLNCMVWGPEIIHETAHGFLEFLEQFQNSSWFNEGSASYTQKFMEQYVVKFLDYRELKKLYLENFVFDEAWNPWQDPKKYKPFINYYMYTAFIIDAYVHEHGINAMHKVYLRLKEMNKGCEGICYSHDDIIKVMVETAESSKGSFSSSSGESITEEDIIYPYRKLFFTDKQLFLQKIEPLVRNVYCWHNEHTQTTYCDAPGDRVENSS